MYHLLCMQKMTIEDTLQVLKDKLISCEEFCVE